MSSGPYPAHQHVSLPWRGLLPASLPCRPPPSTTPAIYPPKLLANTDIPLLAETRVPGSRPRALPPSALPAPRSLVGQRLSLPWVPGCPFAQPPGQSLLEPAVHEVDMRHGEAEALRRGVANSPKTEGQTSLLPHCWGPARTQATEGPGPDSRGQAPASPRRPAAGGWWGTVGGLVRTAQPPRLWRGVPAALSGVGHTRG